MRKNLWVMMYLSYINNVYTIVGIGLLTLSLFKMRQPWGIWVAVLVLICGAAPALLQYRLYIINRHKLREELELYEKIMSGHEINNYVSSLSHCMDAQITADSTISRKMVSMLLRRCTESFDKLLMVVTADKKTMLDPSERDALAITLIQISGVLDRIKIRVKDRSLRQLNELKDKLSKGIDRLIESKEEESDQKLIICISSILADLKRLSIEWDFVEE